MTATAIVPHQPQSAALAQPAELTIDDLIQQVTKIQQAMQKVMKVGEHYGVIPGTGTKPTLLKAGAEKLCLLFRLDPQYDIVSAVDQAKEVTFVIRCTLFHIPTGNRVASGMGSCSSREEKYAYRKATRACPACGVAAIIKGKEEYGGGWLCFKKKDGCGAKFADGDPSIESQESGKVANENIHDQHNTLLKMGCKRALIAAVLNGTAASDIFTQDLEDLVDASHVEVKAQPPASRKVEPQTADPMVTPGLLKTLNAAMTRIGIGEGQPEQEKRATKLHWISKLLGRQVGSSKDLTAAEASHLINLLERPTQESQADNADQPIEREPGSEG